MNTLEAQRDSLLEMLIYYKQEFDEFSALASEEETDSYHRDGFMLRADLYESCLKEAEADYKALQSQIEWLEFMAAN